MVAMIMVMLQAITAKVTGRDGIDYNSFIQNAMANGYTQEQADAYWKENVGS